MRYSEGDRVRVKDPADKRKRINGTVVGLNTGRGSDYYQIVLDDEPETPMAFDESEVTGRPREKDSGPEYGL